MVDHDAVVCCMCGDMGFPDKLFRCARCLSRFQHSYCSNYYSDDYSSGASSGVCDWCRCEERSVVAGARHGLIGTKRDKEGGQYGAGGMRSDYTAGERIKQEESSSRSGRAAKSSGGGGSGGSSAAVVKPGGRRYKLLKDVMC